MRRLAIYPGSFDPLTLGHLDMIERAAKLFDHLIVAVGRNPEKEPFFTLDQRIESIVESTRELTNVKVEAFDGLLIHYAQKKGARSIVRGLRATSDFEYEFQMAMVNRRLNEEIDTVFLMTKWDHSYISSSMVRQVAKLGGEFETMVPPPVVPIIRSVLNSRSGG